jgi:hypothetical protein
MERSPFLPLPEGLVIGQVEISQIKSQWRLPWAAKRSQQYSRTSGDAAQKRDLWKAQLPLREARIITYPGQM